MEKLQSTCDCIIEQTLHRFRISNQLIIKLCHHLPYVHISTYTPQHNTNCKQSPFQPFTKLLNLFQCVNWFVTSFIQSNDWLISSHVCSSSVNSSIISLHQVFTIQKARRAKLINKNMPRAAKFISLRFGRNSGTAINCPKSGFCNIFCTCHISCRTGLRGHDITTCQTVKKSSTVNRSSNVLKPDGWV